MIIKKLLALWVSMVGDVPYADEYRVELGLVLRDHFEVTREQFTLAYIAKWQYDDTELREALNELYKPECKENDPSPDFGPSWLKSYLPRANHLL